MNRFLGLRTQAEKISSVRKINYFERPSLPISLRRGSKLDGDGKAAGSAKLHITVTLKNKGLHHKSWLFFSPFRLTIQDRQWTILSSLLVLA